MRVQSGGARGVYLEIDAPRLPSASAALSPDEARVLGQALIAAANEAVPDGLD
ncbi:hypothetical protein [Leucobacter sp. HY1908]